MVFDRACSALGLAVRGLLTLLFLIAAGWFFVSWLNKPGQHSPQEDQATAATVLPSESPKSFDDANRELLQCLMPEAQYGRYSSFDGGQSAERLLEQKCTKQYLAFVRACTGGEDQEKKKCVVIAAIAAQAAIKQFGK